MGEIVTSMFNAHSDDECTILGPMRQIMKYHRLYLNIFSNGDSNTDVRGNPFLRVNESIDCLNMIAEGSGLEQRMVLNRDILKNPRGNVFAFKASETEFVMDFIFEEDTQRLEQKVKKYTNFVLAMLQYQRPDNILIPDYDGSNETHDFVHLVVREIVKELGNKIKIFRFPGYAVKDFDLSKLMSETPASEVGIYIDGKIRTIDAHKIYEQCCVGRFPQFDELGLHNNGYKGINFGKGLKGGCYKIPEKDKELFYNSIKAFKSQKGLEDFLKNFKDPLYNEILEVDQRMSTSKYMGEGHHVGVGFALYQLHLQLKYGEEHGREIHKFTISHFMDRMGPVLDTVRQTVKEYKAGI